MKRKRHRVEQIIGMLRETKVRPATFSDTVRRLMGRSGLRHALPVARMRHQFAYQEILYSVAMFLRRLTVSLPPGKADVTLFKAQNYVVAVRHDATEKTGFPEEPIFGLDSLKVNRVSSFHHSSCERRLSPGLKPSLVWEHGPGTPATCSNFSLQI